MLIRELEGKALEEHNWLKYGVIGLAVVGFLVLIMIAFRAGDLEGHTWVVEEMTLHALPVKPIEGTTMTAKFEDGSVSGIATCNNYSGPYETDGDSMKMGPFATTLMACTEPQDAMAQESSYLELLGTVDSYEVKDKQLILSSDGVSVVTYGR